jgi:beta-glucosidase
MTHVAGPGWRHARRTWIAGAAAVVLLSAPPAASAHAAEPAPAHASANVGAAQDAATCNGQPAPWMDTHLSPDQRAKLLVATMTLAQETQETATISTATESREVPAIPSLCIPALLLTNGPAGVSTNAPVQLPATALPAPISLAATWDPAAARQYGVVEGNEVLDQGRNNLEGPDIDIARVPENGRTFEAYGEDPYLAGQIVAGNVEGIQSRGVIATPKHFTANNQETNRTTINEIISQRTLEEIYIRPYKDAVDAGAGAVMCAYPQINGVFSCDNSALLGALDNELGFKGYVMSDFGAIHSTVDAANAGTDLELPSPSFYGTTLATAVTGGQVSKATVDGMVERILRTMFAFGLFDKPAPQVQTIPAAKDGATARQLAEAGTVLLKNDGNVLPLDASSLKSVALIGPEADVASAGGGGSAKVAPLYTVSPLQAIGKVADRHHISVVDAGEPPVTLGQDPAIPGWALTAPSGQQGLLAQYFNNSTWSGTPAVSRVEPYVDQYALPPAGIVTATATGSTQRYSVRYTGTLTPRTSGSYTLSLSTNNHATLYLNDAQVLSDGGGFPSASTSTTVELTAGTGYSIELDYSATNVALDELGWELPAGADNPVIDSAVAAAQKASVAVVFVGDETSEGVDRPNLELPGFQDQLISAVDAANPNTVVVLNTGDPVLMPWLSRVKGVVEAWYPGEEDGNAISAVLFGQVNPSGKLPITFPSSETDVPANTPQQYPGVSGVATYSEGLNVGYRYDDATGQTPLFPFGFGLSYTTFAFSNLRVHAGKDGHVEITAQVTDTGSRAGTEVAQLYVGDPASIREPPRQLRGFQQVTLRPGETETVRFTLTGSAVAYWDTARSAWAVAPGTYQVYVGDSSALANLPLRGSFTLPGNAG